MTQTERHGYSLLKRPRQLGLLLELLRGQVATQPYTPTISWRLPITHLAYVRKFSHSICFIVKSIGRLRTTNFFLSIPYNHVKLINMTTNDIYI